MPSSLRNSLAAATSIARVAHGAGAVTERLRWNIRRNPFRNMGVAVAAGIVAGVAVMVALRSRD